MSHLDQNRRGLPALPLLLGIFIGAMGAGFAAPSHAASLQILRIGVARGTIVASTRLVDGFDAKTKDSLERGLPITVRYTADLWRERRHWMDKQIDSRVRTFRVRFHPGERTYTVTEGDREDRRQSFETLAQAIDEISLRDLPIHPRWELQDGQSYFVSVAVAIQPLTWSEFQELDGWVSGKIRGGPEPSSDSSPEPSRGVSRAVFEFLLDRSGFGDSHLRTRSASFVPQALHVTD